MSKRKYKAEQVADALTASGGVIAVAARALGCHRNTVARYIEEYVTVREAYEEANETSLDVAEGGLAAFVRGNIEGMTTRERLDAIKFYLRTKGRHRGYGDRIQVDPGTQAQKIADQLAELRRGYQREYESAIS